MRKGRKIKPSHSQDRKAGITEDKPAAINREWRVLGAVALLGAFLWAFWPTLAEMKDQWVRQPDYSHGFLVLPLALVFLWSKRSTFPSNEMASSIYGASLLMLACALRIAAGALYVWPLDGWTIPIWIAGSVWLLFGKKVLVWCLPSIVFLWFMVPIPYNAESWLSVPLQAVATKLSTVGLVMLGQPALAEGNTIWLGDQQIFIEEACSGLRIFVGIFALAFAFTLFSKWSWWQKALALIAALPIAIIANVGRIVTTGLLYRLVSSDAAMHFSHDFAGIVTIPFAALLFWLFLNYVDRLFPQVRGLSVFEVESQLL